MTSKTKEELCTRCGHKTETHGTSGIGCTAQHQIDLIQDFCRCPWFSPSQPPTTDNQDEKWKTIADFGDGVDLDELLKALDTQASELEDIMLLVDRLDGGDPKHYMLQGKIKAAITRLLREARVDELNKMHESYEVTLSADLDFDPTVYKARRIAQLRKQSKKGAKQ